MTSRMCSCCNRRTCPKFQILATDEEASSQKSSAPEHSDKETQTTPNSLPTREYEVITNYARKHVGHTEILDIDMSSVYKAMEDPYLYRGCLMRIALITSDLVKLIQPNGRYKATNENEPHHNNIFNTKIQVDVPDSVYGQDNAIQLNNCEIEKALQPILQTDLRRKRCHCKKSKSAHASFDCDTKMLIDPVQTVSSRFLSSQSNTRFSQVVETPFEFNVQDKRMAVMDCKVCECQNLTISEDIGLCQNQCKGISQPALIELNAQKYMAQTTDQGTDHDKSCESLVEEPQSANADFLEHEAFFPEICDCGKAKQHISEANKYLAKKRQTLFDSEMKCTCDLSENELRDAMKAQRSQSIIYRKAFPQHKDLDVCIKCRFDPSPLVDKDGHVFCPGNCGCCLCPWKARASSSSDDAKKHNKLKMCKCRDRRSLFTDITEVGSACSQLSSFDICPCREMAESKYLELYGFDMWDKNDRLRNIQRGSQVLLTDVKELVPPNPESTRFLKSKMHTEL